MTISSSYSSSIASTQYTQGTQHKQPPSASDLVSQLMSKSDANEDGLLSVDELSNLSEESFSKMDTNGDGNLSTDELTTSFSSLMESIKNKETSPEEFGNLLSSMGLDVPPPPPPQGGGAPNVEEMTTQIFDAKDTNQDGFVSADELDLDSELFSSMDSDGDGNISKSEMETGLKSLFESAKNGDIDKETFSSIMDKLGVEAPPPPPPPSGSGEESDESTTASTSSTTSMEEYTLKLVSTLLEALQSEQSNNSDEESSLDLKKFKEMMTMVNTQTQNGQTANALSEFLKNLTAGVTTSSSSYA